MVGFSVRVLGKLPQLIAVSLLFLVATAAAETQRPSSEEASGSTRELSLTELCNFERNRTDKCPQEHDFVGVYDRFLSPIRDTATDILEIGVLEGHSLRLWADYFSAATIHGVDIVDKTHLDLPADRVRTYIGDQASRDDLRAVVEKAGTKFDLILDDGGHSMQQQQVTMGFLFPYVKQGGYYILEDLHSSSAGYGDRFGAKKDGSNTTLRMVNRYNYYNKIASQYMTQEEADYISENIEYCSLVHTSHISSLTWICKKK